MNRKEMLQYLTRVAEPLLTAAANDELKATMPMEQMPAERVAQLYGPGFKSDREQFTCFEAVGRLVCGLSPWLAGKPADEEEAALQTRYINLCCRAIRNQLDPTAKDYAKFDTLNYEYSQILVDMACLVQGLYRGRKALLDTMDSETRALLLRALLEVRKIKPHRNNWLLFPAFVEAGLYLLTGEYDEACVNRAVDQLEKWYVGDGMYKDGDWFAMDYYTSLVMQPMLLDLTSIFKERWTYPVGQETYLRRMQRYAAIQERQIAPDGTYIVIGRSAAYRGGVFNALMLAALFHILPAELPPSQVRSAISAVVEKTLGESSFDERGFLRIGVYGSQPGLGEPYISTGSLYACSAVFIPFGLPAEDAFWAGPELPWTQKRIWSGEDLPFDHKLAE